MKRAILSITAGVLMAATVVAQAASSDAIGVVNMKSVFRAAPQVKSINDQLKKQFKPQQDKILHQAQGLQADYKNYQKNRTVMTKTKLSALEDKIAREKAMIRAEQTSYQIAVQKEQAKLMAGFIAKLKIAVGKVAQQKHLTVVVPANVLIYATPEKDITNEVIQKLK